MAGSGFSYSVNSALLSAAVIPWKFGMQGFPAGKMWSREPEGLV